VLQTFNEMRCADPTGFNHSLDSWSELEWGGATAGELGEACNLAKKIIRIRDGVRGNREGDDLATLRAKCGKEFADTIIYCCLAMAKLGLDAESVVRDVFNNKSDEIGWKGPRL
jgi:NTP pyrophosphatase (non-canonical NTP hydrolase)